MAPSRLHANKHFHLNLIGSIMSKSNPDYWIFLTGQCDQYSKNQKYFHKNLSQVSEYSQKTLKGRTDTSFPVKLMHTKLGFPCQVVHGTSSIFTVLVNITFFESSNY